jgi:hypothetical protein
VQPESGHPGVQDTGKIPADGRGDTQTAKKDGSGTRNGVRPVVIKFGFDPVRSREMNVALVHSGDRISVKVRRGGRSDCGLFLTFGYFGTFETDAYREWSVGSRSGPGVPMRDGRRIALTGTGEFSADVPGKLDSKDGAVLKLGAQCYEYAWLRSYGDDRQRCEIEMTIYPGNRWNIRPKSLL